MRMPISRRDWMLASLCWSELLAARAAGGSSSFAVLSSAEAVEIVALSGTVLPETETPGAEQAGAVRFIDAALAGFDHDQLAVYRHGLADVASRSRQMFPPATRFSGLSGEQRTAVLKSIEKTEFFEKLRTHTILAYFGNPRFGWKLLGRDPAMHFEPPFGFYDAESKAQ
jgi:gluconate 2-dehydrogenase gamma chain